MKENGYSVIFVVLFFVLGGILLGVIWARHYNPKVNPVDKNDQSSSVTDPSISEEISSQSPLAVATDSALLTNAEKPILVKDDLIIEDAKTNVDLYEDESDLKRSVIFMKDAHAYSKDLESLENHLFFKDPAMNQEEVSLLFTSPDSKKLLFNRNSNGDWYVVDRHGKLIKKIELTKIKAEFPKYQYFTPLNFSSDSREIVFRAANFDPPLDKTSKQASEQLIGSYSFNNDKTMNLYSASVQPIYRVFYDPQKSYLAYQVFDTWVVFTTVDLKNKSTKSNTLSELANYVNGVWGRMGSFLARFENGSAKVIEIVSVNEPEKVTAKIVSENERYFDKQVNWSSDQEIFSVKYRKDMWGNDTYLNFYKKDGTLISSTPHAFNVGDPSMVYSPDNKYLLSWQVTQSPTVIKNEYQALEVETGKTVGKVFSLDTVGLPRFWIGK